MKSLECRIIENVKSGEYGKYGEEDFYFQDREGVQFGGKRWTSANETWSSLDRNNPLLHTSTWDVASNELTWALRHATVKYWVDVSEEGGINIEYRLYDTLDLTPQDGRREAYNTISKTLGFFYHDLLGGNKNLQTRAEWNTRVKK